jgi:hypothetical protein
MKKLLSILSAIGIISTAATAAVACDKPVTYTTSIKLETTSVSLKSEGTIDIKILNKNEVGELSVHQQEDSLVVVNIIDDEISITAEQNSSSHDEKITISSINDTIKSVTINVTIN